MWDSKTLRLVTRVEMIERPFGHMGAVQKPQKGF